ncbi:hypothetical protein DMC01_03680 [Campylobacter troglodytis]|nr:hypothetical protein DMC01_03680 [Campylobacter troglodytis]
MFLLFAFYFEFFVKGCEFFVQNWALLLKSYKNKHKGKNSLQAFLMIIIQKSCDFGMNFSLRQLKRIIFLATWLN